MDKIKVKPKCVLHPNHMLNAVKSGEQSKLRKEKRIVEYLENPKYCKYCNNIIEYQDRNEKVFCNRSCSRSYMNINRSMGDNIKSKISCSLKKYNENELNNKITKYESHPKKCKQCGGNISYDNRNRSFCSDECRYIRRRYVAINLSNLGGNKNRNGLWYESNIAGKVYLESSYELLVAQELDKNKILWCRPKYLQYNINGVEKKYYPDFYLMDYDIYLDPKNFFLIEKDTIKIELVVKQKNVRILILNKNQLSWNVIKELI